MGLFNRLPDGAKVRRPSDLHRPSVHPHSCTPMTAKTDQAAREPAEATPSSIYAPIHTPTMPASLARQAEQPTHHPPPTPALVVVYASSGSSSLPSLTWESNPIKLSGHHAAGADLRQSAYIGRPCLWPPQPPVAPIYYLVTQVAFASTRVTRGKFREAQASQ